MSDDGTDIVGDDDIPPSIEDRVDDDNPAPIAPDQLQDDDAANGSEQQPSAASSVQLENPDQVELEQLAELLAPMYEDTINLAIEALEKEPQTFPSDRARRRGKQLAIVLRRLGWDDEEIIAYAGVVTGVGSDIVWIKNLPDRETDDDQDDDEDEPGEAAPVQEVPGGG
jgi:hypothetical protein